MGAGITSAAVRGTAITPHDTTVFEPTRAIYVGVAGDAVVRFAGQELTTTLVGLLAGAIYPFAVDKVLDTGTDADSLVALY